MRCPLLLALLSLSCLGRLDAESRPAVLHLSLGSAMRMALAKNFTLEVQRFEPQIAKENITAEWGAFDPTFELSASRDENSIADSFILGRHVPFNQILPLNAPRAGIGRIDSALAGLRGLSPWGLRYDLNLGTVNRTDSDSKFADQYTATSGLGLVQPLLRNFGTDANLAQVRLARTNFQISEWDLRQQTIDILTTTNFIYNELHFAHENLRAAVRSRDLALQLLADNIKRAEIGVMSPLNITTARAEAAARKEAVLVAERQVKDNENLLKQLVTNDVEKILQLRVEIERPPSPKFRADVPKGITEALASRPDYRSLQLDLQKRNITLAYTKNQALPRLDLEGSLKLLGFDNDFSTSVDRSFRRDQTAWSAGAIFSVPLPNREGRSKVASARLAIAQSLVSLQRLEQQIVVDVDNASGQIVTARQRIESTTEARALAQESLDAGQERLRAGTGTTFEVLELQKKLAEAEAAELRAQSDYNKAVSEYYRQTGTSLQVYGVTVR